MIPLPYTLSTFVSAPTEALASRNGTFIIIEPLRVGLINIRCSFIRGAELAVPWTRVDRISDLSLIVRSMSLTLFVATAYPHMEGVASRTVRQGQTRLSSARGEP